MSDVITHRGARAINGQRFLAESMSSPSRHDSAADFGQSLQPENRQADHSMRLSLDEPLQSSAGTAERDASHPFSSYCFRAWVLNSSCHGLRSGSLTHFSSMSRAGCYGLSLVVRLHSAYWQSSRTGHGLFMRAIYQDRRPRAGSLEWASRPAATDVLNAMQKGRRRPAADRGAYRPYQPYGEVMASAG